MDFNVSGKELIIRNALFVTRTKQVEIASMIGVSKGQVSKLINGEKKCKKFDAFILEKISKIFN